MEFIEFIEKARRNQKLTDARLAEIIGVRPQDLCAAKKGRRGLPDQACEKLAELAEADFGDVIRARMRQRGAASCPFALALFALSLITLAYANVKDNSYAKSFMTYANADSYCFQKL